MDARHHIYKVSKMYEKTNERTQLSGISYFSEGTDRAYFFLNFIDYDTKTKKTYATHYFEVFFDKLLKIASGCSQGDVIE